MLRSGLSFEGLKAAFPFHFGIDRDLRFQQATPRLGELCPEAREGGLFTDAFRIERPSIELTFDAIKARSELVFMLRSRSRELALRGQILHEPGPDLLLFLGSPWVTDLQQLGALDLTLADFPAHAAHGDLLMLIQAKNAGLRDAHTLADKLKVLTEKLRARNQDLESEIVRAERLASLGRLVAGVAHEINTPLGVAVTGASLVKEQLSSIEAIFKSGQLKKGDLRRFLDDAGQAAGIVEANLGRAADLITSFKRVAIDQTSLERRSIKLAAYVDEVLASLGPLLKKAAVKAEVLAPEGDVELTTYPGAISQIVTNLVTNAVEHAFTPDAAGTLRFRVGTDAGSALLVCEDDGRGMPSDVLSRIFEPFFTTRRGSGGSGLGMHIVHNLVTDALDGRVTVASEPGSGTCVTIRLPLSGGGNLE
jgi:signal transduction histidine kinase